ncbi:hypothetical protein SPRG_09323 [Saprolegnia parasitica CBS 223.65]|uniref:Uncharacterized protein n=1 Tax=Saprolegnia parasitica (strain CBS 223.65) TaxID=695850 RepID=A0A067CEY5_SAPPC|nr:hypothetical protein SPRG_09323 [Saprolegnia parasitica CBS 223.65]KDO25382.1 hypothetical protein SPRG_09323 [Saprolegnia parasitica CBS 223.65]|eukprot:XP_012203810.1 hypothetical protein SPRG_09323 [Saprolegnia parasitica CBS 223.65]
MAAPLAFNDAVVRSYSIARVFPGDEDAVMTSIDFHRAGNVAVTARSDGTINAINCITGTSHKTILTKKYGVDLLRTTHHPDCLLWSSQNDANDHSVRYHSLFDNKFLRFYAGHTAKITSLMMHPTADEFLTASMDGTFRIWDIRSPDARGELKCGDAGRTISAAYDTDGLVFGVYTGDGIVRMYDARNFTDGPFAKFPLTDDSIAVVLRPLLQQRKFNGKLDVLSLTFSPDQQHLLLSTNAGVLIQLDAFEGKLKRIFASHSNLSGTKLGVGYSPDGKFIACGADDGSICIYDAHSGAVTVPALQGHVGPVFDLQWNPQRHLLGSVHANTLFWLPNL